MKIKFNVITIIATFFIKGSVSKYLNDNHYLIYIDNTIPINQNNNLYKRQHGNDFINNSISEIHNLIVNNLNSYQNPEALTKLDEKHNKLKKRNNIENSLDSNYVYPISTIGNKTVLSAFLSADLVEIVKSYPNVKAVKENRKIENDDYYNINDIKRTTGWKNVNVRENAELHLSLLSQGKYNEELVNNYDPNYYYSSSAGEGINIIIVDTGFNFRHPEFSNKEERITKCVVRMVDGKPDHSVPEDNCGTNNPYHIKDENYHGEWVSDIAAGLKYGVAPKANVYGVAAIETGYTMANLISAVQYVSEHLIKPYKTVVSLSLGSFYPIKGEDEERDHWIRLINSITEKGAIVVAAAHNFGKNTYNVETNEQMLPCVLDNVICVGGTDNIDGLTVTPKEFLKGLTQKVYQNIKISNNMISVLDEMSDEECETYKKLLITLIQKAYGENTQKSKVLINKYIQSDDELSEESDKYEIILKVLYDASNVNKLGVIKTKDLNDKDIHSEYFIPEMRNNVKFNLINKKYEKLIDNYNGTVKYQLGDWSDYGKNVDIYGPGFFYAEYQNINSENKGTYGHGTSFTTPIVSGVIATVMSDNPNVNFTPKTMLEHLQNIGLKNIISGIPEGYPNLFINNGKRLVYSSDKKYYGCGIQAGNTKCPSNQCCSPEGKCTKDKNLCKNNLKRLIRNY